jgi:hypothetical protein
MAIVEPGFFDRRETIGDSADVPYIVFEAADEAAVRAACDENIPGELEGLLRKEIEIEEQVNATTWRVVARYEKPAPWQGSGGESPESKFAFDTGGGTQHITQSLQTVRRYGPKASTMLGGAIGYDGKSVQGVDITVPVFNFSETHYFTNDEVTRAFQMTLFALTGRYNLGAFRGFAAGEVLFLGAAGSRQGDDPDDLWELSFRFAASPNRNDIMVDAIGPITKLGWEYLWVQYADDADDEKKQIVKRPVAVYIEKVYHGGDFADLGIGVE